MSRLSSDFEMKSPREDSSGYWFLARPRLPSSDYRFDGIDTAKLTLR